MTLNPAMRAALTALASRSMYKRRDGYTTGREGDRHATGTLRALERRGLCARELGGVRITEAGRQALAAAGEIKPEADRG